MNKKLPIKEKTIYYVASFTPNIVLGFVERYKSLDEYRKSPQWAFADTMPITVTPILYGKTKEQYPKKTAIRCHTWHTDLEELTNNLLIDYNRWTNPEHVDDTFKEKLEALNELAAFRKTL